MEAEYQEEQHPVFVSYMLFPKCLTLTILRVTSRKHNIGSVWQSLSSLIFTEQIYGHWAM